MFMCVSMCAYTVNVWVPKTDELVCCVFFQVSGRAPLLLSFQEDPPAGFGLHHEDRGLLSGLHPRPLPLDCHQPRTPILHEGQAPLRLMVHGPTPHGYAGKSQTVLREKFKFQNVRANLLDFK